MLSLPDRLVYRSIVGQRSAERNVSNVNLHVGYGHRRTSSALNRCGIADVAHVVTTHALAVGDIKRARAAAEIAQVAAPYEEMPRLDLVAVRAAEGHLEEAEDYLRDQVCNRSDDDGAPEDLSERTQAILRHREWLSRTG